MMSLKSGLLGVANISLVRCDPLILFMRNVVIIFRMGGIL